MTPPEGACAVCDHTYCPRCYRWAPECRCPHPHSHLERVCFAFDRGQVDAVLMPLLPEAIIREPDDLHRVGVRSCLLGAVQRLRGLDTPCSHCDGRAMLPRRGWRGEQTYWPVVWLGMDLLLVVVFHHDAIHAGYLIGPMAVRERLRERLPELTHLRAVIARVTDSWRPSAEPFARRAIYAAIRRLYLKGAANRPHCVAAQRELFGEPTRRGRPCKDTPRVIARRRYREQRKNHKLPMTIKEITEWIEWIERLPNELNLQWLRRRQ